jgi:hypothetical protein
LLAATEICPPEREFAFRNRNLAGATDAIAISPEICSQRSKIALGNDTGNSAADFCLIQPEPRLFQRIFAAISQPADP